MFNAEVNNSQSISTLLDNGSEGELFDHSLAHQLKLPIFKLKKKIPLYLANDEKLQDIAEATLVDLRIGEHVEQVMLSSQATWVQTYTRRRLASRTQSQCGLEE